MKVRIMDYETAKAKVLAREQNPCYANDKTVWGVDKTWVGWGQVRDVEKRFDNSFCDVEDGYVFPLYLIFIGIFFIPPFRLNVKFAIININNLHKLMIEDAILVRFTNKIIFSTAIAATNQQTSSVQPRFFNNCF